MKIPFFILLAKEFAAGFRRQVELWEMQTATNECLLR